MPHLNSGFPGVAPPAKDLQIRQDIGEVRPIPDRLDVVAFKTTPRAALDALPAIPLKRLHPQGLPTWAARDVPGMAAICLEHAHDRTTWMS